MIIQIMLKLKNMVNISKGRYNAHLENKPTSGIIFPDGTELEVVGIDTYNYTKPGGKPDDMIILRDIGTSLTYSMTLRSFLILRGDRGCKEVLGEIVVAKTITILSSTDRVSAKDEVMYPHPAYNGYREYCNRRIDWFELVNSGIRPDNTLKPKQYYTVSSKFK